MSGRRQYLDDVRIRGDLHDDDDTDGGTLSVGDESSRALPKSSRKLMLGQNMTR